MKILPTNLELKTTSITYKFRIKTYLSFFVGTLLPLHHKPTIKAMDKRLFDAQIKATEVQGLLAHIAKNVNYKQDLEEVATRNIDGDKRYSFRGLPDARKVKPRTNKQSRMKKNLPIPQENKDIVVSWVYTWSRQKEMSVNEQHVILRILESCQNQVQGLKIKDNMHKIEHGLWNVELTMPISDAFFSNYKVSEVKKTLLSLRERSFEYDNSETGEWWACGFIEKPEAGFKKGMMKFEVDNRLWDVFMNFTKGYREFELSKALSLSTSYSLRFYMLISGQKAPIQMTIENFRKWLGIPEDKYIKKDGTHRIDNIEARIIKPAQKELDKTCPYSFEYKKIRENPKNPRSKVTQFIFYPKYIQKNRDPELEKKELQGKVGNITGAYGMLDKAVSDYLLYNLNMTKDEINANKALFLTAQQTLPNLVEHLADLRERAARSGKGTGWIINGLKGKLKTK